MILHPGIGGIIAYGRGMANNILAGHHVLLEIFASVISPILPLAKIITGSGLILLKRWAYGFTILTILVDFIINFFGTINYTISYCLLSNMDIMSLTVQGGLNRVAVVEMWPVYIIALVDLLFLSVLTRYEKAR